MTTNDVKWMREALLEAKLAFDKKEVPIGAILVLEDQILARAHNEVESKSDASRHAELICLQRGAAVLGNWRLKECTLYSTLEPCAMCAGALALFRVKRVVYGAPDLRHGADGTVFSVLSYPHPIHQVEVTRGVLEEEARELMQTFFRMRRLDVNII